MDDADTLMDRIRALVEGRLSPDEATSVRREVEDEPEGPELLEAYRVVHEVTVPTMLESVETTSPIVPMALARKRRVPAAAWLRRAAVLLLVLSAGVAVGLAMRDDAEGPRRKPADTPADAPRVASGPVAIRALADSEPPAPSEPPAVPAELADYRSVRDGVVQWLDDPAVARRISELTSRPVLWFIYHPSCPICIGFENGPLHDADVLRRLDALVPVRIDVTAVPPDLRAGVERRLRPRHWPYLAVEDRKGRLLAAVQAAQTEPSVIAGQIDAGLSVVPDLAERIDWRRANRAGRRLLEGRWAFDEGRYGDAERAFQAARRVAAGPLSEVVERALEAVRSAARVRFDVIRRGADADPSAATEELARAAADFAGTPYAEEFEAVRKRLAATGRFPPLKIEKDD